MSDEAKIKFLDSNWELICTLLQGRISSPDEKMWNKYSEETLDIWAGLLAIYDPYRYF